MARSLPMTMRYLGFVDCRQTMLLLGALLAYSVTMSLVYSFLDRISDKSVISD